LAIVLRRDQQRQQIVAGSLPPFRDIAAQEIGKFSRCAIGRLFRFACAAMHVHGDHLMRPVEQLRPHLDRHAEHFGNDGDRQRRCEGWQQVDLARFETVDQLIGERLDTRPEPLDLTRDEGAVDQRSEPGVHGWLQLQHRIGLDAVEGAEMRAVLADAASGGDAGRILAAEAAVAQQPVDVVEAAKAPEAELSPEEDIRCAMHEGIGLIGVLEESRLVRVQSHMAGGGI
jgi:hypothetical protein